MGHDTANVLPKETKEKEAIEFLKILGYYGRGKIYAFYKDEDYKYFDGVTLLIGREDDKDRNSNLIIQTHTSIWCSDYDLEFQNYTVKQLKKRFGGYFYTDNGKGRYLEVSETKSLGAQNGCYFAFFNLHNQFTQAKYFLSEIEESDTDKFLREYSGHGNFVSLATNITTTYIASIIENYFRDTYVALLKYSNKKERIFKNSKIHPGDMLDISNGEATIEKAIAYAKPFQNIHKIHSNFKELDISLDIFGILSKPYRRRKETLFQTIDRVLEHRHGVVHRLDLNSKYDKSNALKDIDSVNNGWL